MKIRSGFVSNSSTSSFCLYGACFRLQEIHNIFSEDDTDIDSWVGRVFKGTCVSYVEDGEEGVIYLGAGPENMEDNETAGAFKKEIEDSLRKVFGKKIECSWVEATIQC